jgi:hypothetical protein
VCQERFSSYPCSCSVTSYRCLTTDSLPRGYPGQLFGLRHMLELDGECRDSRFTLVWALNRDRVIALRPVGVSLLRWNDYVVLSLVTGVPTPSLYIDREGCGAVTILVGSKRRYPKLNTEVTFYRNPASLAYSTRIRCSGCCTSPCSGLMGQARAHNS